MSHGEKERTEDY